MSFLWIVLAGGGLLVTLLGRVLVGLLTAEAVATVPYVNRTLVRRAAERLPPECRDRFAEEWEAHVADFGERRLAGLKWAIGISLGARKLAAELAPAPQPERVTDLPPRDGSDDESERALEGWRRVGRVAITHVIISTPRGDHKYPLRRRRIAVLLRLVQSLRAARRTSLQRVAVATTVFGQLGREARALFFGMTAMLRELRRPPQEALQALRLGLFQAVALLAEAQAEARRVLATLAPHVPAVVLGLSVAALLVGVLALVLAVK